MDRAARQSRNEQEEAYQRKVAALYGMLADVFGPDRVVLKAGKVGALKLMRSDDLTQRIVALQRLVYDDPTIDANLRFQDIPETLAQLQDELADMFARRTVEDEIEQKIQDRMAQKHEEYVNDIRAQIMRETSPETAETKRRLERLQALEERHLARSLADVLRPRSFGEVVGQDEAVQALLAKLASPYPQHILLYGPPGVGKTTAARLALEAARSRPGAPFAAEAPFVETDGATLRWDPREVTNPLLGSVHDPIYQGARQDLAEGGVPEPKLGLVSEAHGGVLFIDEVGEMDPVLQNKLLKVLEDKRVKFESSYYDPDDPHVPEYVHRLFKEGAPADFVLIGATTRDPEEITPALRSRCAEIYFGPLTPADIRSIVRQGAAKLGAGIEDEAVAAIAERTIEARKALNILADAYSLALHNGAVSEAAQSAPAAADDAATAAGQRSSGAPAASPDPTLVTAEHVARALSAARIGREARPLALTKPQMGRVIGLAVRGFLGSALEIEALVHPAREPGKGKLRFNETAGSMARDSVFTAGTLVRRLTGHDLADYDVHVNVVGGGQIDGPSAGAAVFVAVYSAVTRRMVRQDTAVTGEIALSGAVQEVGGIPEKLYGARQTGVQRVVLPAANSGDVPHGQLGLELAYVDHAEALLREMLN